MEEPKLDLLKEENIPYQESDAVTYEQRDCYTIRFSDLIQQDARWSSVLQLFRQLCTKPKVLPDYSLKKEKWLESRTYPDLDKVDEEEKVGKLVVDIYPDETGWACGNKCGNFGINTPGTLMNRILLIMNQLITQMAGTPQFRGLFFYPPGSFHEWHSNQYQDHGWRLYFIGAPDGGDSSFYYLDRKDKNIVEVKDEDAVINIFRIGVGDDILYHTVSSYTANRWSIGFKLEETDMQKLLSVHFPLTSLAPNPNDS